MRGVQRKGEAGESESSGDSSDSDSMELDLTNTDLESRLGDTRPPSRARSYRCHTSHVVKMDTCRCDVAATAAAAAVPCRCGQRGPGARARPSQYPTPRGTGTILGADWSAVDNTGR